MGKDRLLLLAVVLVTAGCSGRVEKDDRPAFRIDPAQPFRLEFGRGSGVHGLNTIKIDHAGRVVFHRMKSVRREDATALSRKTATLQLAPEAVGEVLNAVEANGLMRLHKAYHGDVHDGAQWICWIRQGEREKAVYFNNNFPREITTFAKQLDGILARAGSAKLAWQPVGLGESRQHGQELWASIKR
jgi:hypothetical protein